MIGVLGYDSALQGYSGPGTNMQYPRTGVVYNSYANTCRQLPIMPRVISYSTLGSSRRECMSDWGC